MSNPDANQRQGCQSLVKAAYYQFKPELTGVYNLDDRLTDIEKDLNNRLPLEVKTVIIIADALNNKSVYIPLYHKEF